MTSSQQHDYAFERVNESVMTRTLEGRINSWNRSAEDLYGWRKEEAIGRVSHELLQTQFPQPLREIDSELVRNGRWQGKLVHTTRNGGRVVVESRWILDSTGQPGAVVEINKRSTDYEMDRDARTDRDSVEIGRQEPSPTSKLAKTETLLPKFANTILTGAGVFCLLALSYLVYHYWTGQRQITGRSAMLLYYGLPALLTILCFASLRLSAARKVNLAVLLCSVGMSLYSAETFLALWSSLPSVMESEKRQMRASAAKAAGVKFDSRSREQVIDDLRRQGVDVVPSIFGQAFVKPKVQRNGKSSISIDGKEVLPLGGVSNKLVVLCNEAGQYVTYRSDSHGFHNPEDVWNKVPISIAVLGDSYPQGYCVPPHRTFVAQIRERHPGTLNLGIEGNGPLLMLASLKEYAASARPKVVLWFHFEGNDLPDLSDEAEHSILRNYLNRHAYRQGLMDRQAQIDRALLDYLETVRSKSLLRRQLEEAWQLIKNPKLSTGRIMNVAKLGELRNRLGLVYTGPAESNKNQPSMTRMNDRNHPLTDLFTRVLLTAKQEVDSWGGKLYFIYLPGWSFYGDPKRAERADPHRGRVLKIVETLGIPLIDMHPVFMQQPDPLDLFPFRGLPAHYNEKGNRLVADEVLRSISVQQ